MEEFIKVLEINQTPVLELEQLLSIYMISPVNKAIVLIPKWSSQYSTFAYFLSLSFTKTYFHFLAIFQIPKPSVDVGWLRFLNGAHNLKKWLQKIVCTACVCACDQKHGLLFQLSAGIQCKYHSLGYICPF